MIDARACYVWPSEVFVRDSWNSSDKARNKVSSRQISLTTNLARNEKIEKKEKGKKNPLKKKKKKKETIRRRRKKKEVKKIQRYIEKSRHRLTNTISFFFLTLDGRRDRSSAPIEILLCFSREARRIFPSWGHAWWKINVNVQSTCETQATSTEHLRETFRSWSNESSCLEINIRSMGKIVFYRTLKNIPFLFFSISLNFSMLKKFRTMIFSASK